NAHMSAPILMSADLARAHDIERSLKTDREAPGEPAVVRTTNGTVYFWAVPPLPAARRAIAKSDWRALRDDLSALERSPSAHQGTFRIYLSTLVWPLLADALAHLGDFGAADDLIGKTPRDCYVCVQMRGNIRAAERKWGAA